MTTENALINVENLHKSFGKINVLKGISTQIRKGELFALP